MGGARLGRIARRANGFFAHPGALGPARGRNLCFPKRASGANLRAKMRRRRKSAKQDGEDPMSQMTNAAETSASPRFVHFAERIRAAAAAKPDLEVIKCAGEARTWREFLPRINQ